MMFGGVQGMTGTNQMQGQNANVMFHLARSLRRQGRRGSGTNGLNAQQQADLMTHGSQLRMDEMTHQGNVEMTKVGNRAHVADQEYIRAHGESPDPDTGIVPNGGHMGAARRANATFDKNGRHNGNTSWSMKPTAGGGLTGGASNAGTMNPTTMGASSGTYANQTWITTQPGNLQGQTGTQASPPPGAQGGPQGGGPQGGGPHGGGAQNTWPYGGGSQTSGSQGGGAYVDSYAVEGELGGRAPKRREIEGRRQLPSGERPAIGEGQQFTDTRKPLALGSTRSPLELPAGSPHQIDPKINAGKRKKLGNILQTVIPYAEEAGEAAI